MFRGYRYARSVPQPDADNTGAGSEPSPEPRVEQVGDGVYAWIQPHGDDGVANAGVIVDDDGITIVDTLMVRSQWEVFERSVAELGPPVRRIVLTHAHIDQVGGTEAFKNAAVYGSQQTSDLLDQPMNFDAYKTFMPRFTDEFDDLAQVGTRTVTHTIDAPARLSARAEVLPAPGHTAGDLMVLVEDCDVCFTGDICSFGVTPLGFQGDLEAWANVLEIVPLLALKFVPGHGQVGGGEDVANLRAYLRVCMDANGDPSAIPPGPWDSWRERRHDTINVERAALLARGDDQIPPAMLRAIGLA